MELLTGIQHTWMICVRIFKSLNAGGNPPE